MTSDNVSSLIKELIIKARKEPAKIPKDIAQIEDQAEKERLRLENQALELHLNLQMRWSWIIGGILGLSTLCVWGMIFFLGLQKLNFENYPWFPHTIVGTFFGEVVGLGLVVAKYLFPSIKKR